MRTILVRPTAHEFAEFAAPDVSILNAGQTPADPKTPGVSSAVSVTVSLATGEIVILGTDYAAEMKAALFTLASYRFAQRGSLAMRASAIEDAAGRISLLVGLPATGKTALAIGAGQRLVADDAIAWTDRGVSTLEAGCHPRCRGLLEQPALNAAIRFGALLENVVVNPRTRLPDYRDQTLTENTRAVFPLDHVAGAKIPAVADRPSNLILLTCDATGALPPVSRLTAEQAAYFYLSGYTSKLPTTAGGTAEAVFSSCHGAGLAAQSPELMLESFLERLRAHAPQAWLLNTGWSGRPFGAGDRLSLADSQAIVTAIVSRALHGQQTTLDPVFGLEVPALVEGVSAERLHPWEAWSNAGSYRAAALHLAEQFQANAQQFADWVPADVAAAGPRFSEVAAT
jgi:phosphoenolpyruvate carboxykinase (ATP)